MMVDNPLGSQDVYERVREVIGLERPAGDTFHLAGPSPSRRRPGASQPRFWPVHSHASY